MKVLISEDNNQKFKDVENYFKSNNYKIKRTISVKETLIELKHNQYDILVQDMQLPTFSDSHDINTHGGADCIEGAEYRNMLPEIVFIFSSNDVQTSQNILDMYNIKKEVNVVQYDPCINWEISFDKILKD